jgi:hypothetical protein
VWQAISWAGGVQAGGVLTRGEATHRTFASGQSGGEIVGAAQAALFQHAGSCLAGRGRGVIEAERHHRPFQLHPGRTPVGQADQPAANLALQAAVGLVGVDFLE